MNIDVLNRKILKCLQENARLSNAEIGRRVGISLPQLQSEYGRWKTQVLSMDIRRWYLPSKPATS